MAMSHSRETSEDLPADAAGLFASAASVAEASAALVTNVLDHVAQLVGDVAGDAERVAREAIDLWDVARRRASDVSAAMRATPRFTRIAGELTHLVAAYRWHEATRPWRTGLGDEAAEADALAALHRNSAERLYRMCVELRGGVLKLGQFASSRMDLLPDAYVTALARLQDRVPPVPVAQIAARVADELGAAPEAIFATFAAQPIAAASLAQVHAAALADGTRVAVKVQVPGIEDIVETDLAALRFAAPVLADWLAFADLETVAAELSRAVRLELDYEAEARHAAAFAVCFAGDPDVIVPRIHAELSTHRVLTLEHIDGERLLDYLDGCEGRGEDGARDRDRLFEILIGSFCAQVLEHGLLHADPHPGNFLVVTGAGGPRLALLDFGSVQTYDAARRRAYAELALAILAGDAARLAVLFDAMGFHSRDGSADALHAFADLMLDAFRNDAAFDPSTLDPKAALERILHLTRDNPIVGIPNDFVLLGRVFAVLGGLLLRYRPQINLFQLLMPRLVRATQES